MRARSMLFGPALRVDFVEKFARSGADIGVLDLEDATPEFMKASARDILADVRPGVGLAGPMRLFVRTNSLGSTHFADDLVAAAEAGVGGPGERTSRRC